MSAISLVANASVLVQLVMALLLLASFFSWYYIFIKVFVIKRANGLADEFEKEFWSGALTCHARPISKGGSTGPVAMR
jgi:biopolymer transport protein TolQ